MTPFERLMATIRKRFGMIPGPDIGRIKQLSPEQQEALLDVVVLAGSLEYFLSQIPAAPKSRLKDTVVENQSTKLASRGSEESANQRVPVDFAEPPQVPRQPEKLAEAIGLLKEWRTIASNPQARKALKQMLTRFPENNYQAGLWFQYLREVQQARQEETASICPESSQSRQSRQPFHETKPFQPLMETEAESETEPEVEMKAELQGKSEWDLARDPETAKPMTPLGEPPSDNGKVTALSVAEVALTAHAPATSAPTSKDQEPEPPQQVQPSSAPAYLVAPHQGDLSANPGYEFEVATQQPFRAVLRLEPEKSATSGGTITLNLRLTMPCEEFYFAQGVASRVARLDRLENHLLQALAGFFLGAEQELTYFHPGRQDSPSPKLKVEAGTIQVPISKPFSLTMQVQKRILSTVHLELAAAVPVPETEWKFAQGVARRVPRFEGLEPRFFVAVTRFFVDAEGELANSHQTSPVALSDDGQTARRVPELDSREMLPLFASKVSAPGSLKPVEPKTDLLVKPACPALDQPAEPLILKLVPASLPKDADDLISQAEPAVAPPAPFSEKTLGTAYRKRTQEFFIHFNELVQSIRKAGGSLAKTFPTSVHTVKHLLRGDAIPRPDSLLRILQDLARLPLANREPLWPYLQPVLATYQDLRGSSPEFSAISENLTAVGQNLRPKAGFGVNSTRRTVD